jgi:hypothetical protein
MCTLKTGHVKPPTIVKDFPHSIAVNLMAFAESGKPRSRLVHPYGWKNRSIPHRWTLLAQPLVSPKTGTNFLN